MFTQSHLLQYIFLLPRLTHHIAKGKPGTIEITQGGEMTGITKGKNGHLMVVSSQQPLNFCLLSMTFCFFDCTLQAAT